ncbi:MAG TPA: PAS domain S-box protein [Methylomirabilota bacterium]|nr:PAS domain S-box protein [Methylomirabilota bacterium]
MGGHDARDAEIRELRRRIEELEAMSTLLESASQGIVAIDRTGAITLVNARLAEMFGYRREELLGQSLEVLVPRDLRGPHAEHRGRFVANPHVRPMGVGLDLTGQRKDGTRFPVEISLSYTGAGEALRCVGFVTDISERKQAEEALRRSEAQARAVLEAAGQAILVVDERGGIVSANRQAETMFGVPRERMVGTTVETLMPERLRARHTRHTAGYFADPRVRPMGRGLDLVACRADGTEFPVEISLSYVRTDEGLRALAFVTDITQRRAMERASRQTERLTALGQLSAGFAHEVNNPVGVMTTRIELMLMDAEANTLPAEVVEDLRVLHRHAQRVATITNGLLSFARQSPQEHTLVDLNEIVDAVLVLVAPQYERQGVRVRYEAAALPPVLGQANALQQVVLNLVTNAAQAMPDGGDVTITTSVGDRTVRLVVADTGAGIAPEHLSRIFEPFFTTKPSGTGLGLSVTYGILNDHHATVEVDSTPGKGTRFVLTFPVADAGA